MSWNLWMPNLIQPWWADMWWPLMATTKQISGKLEKSKLSTTTYNCRGLSSGIPYILHLIENGSDVITLPEHWLWPCNIASLSNIHQDLEGFGYCDERLNDACTLNKRCGGIGIIWRKSIQAVPHMNIVSNRLCAIQLRLNDTSCVTIIAVYLPSTNYARDDFVTKRSQCMPIRWSYDDWWRFQC